MGYAYPKPGFGSMEACAVGSYVSGIVEAAPAADEEQVELGFGLQDRSPKPQELRLGLMDGERYCFQNLASPISWASACYVACHWINLLLPLSLSLSPLPPSLCISHLSYFSYIYICAFSLSTYLPIRLPINLSTAL